MQLLHIKPRSNINTDQFTDYEMFMHLKRINQISPFKNGILFD